MPRTLTYPKLPDNTMHSYNYRGKLPESNFLLSGRRIPNGSKFVAEIGDTQNFPNIDPLFISFSDL